MKRARVARLSVAILNDNKITYVKPVQIKVELIQAFGIAKRMECSDV
jgi:hypothetical protein